MNITVEWHNVERTILLYTFAAAWEWEEYYSAIEQGLWLLDSVQHPVHVICNFEQTDLLPPKALSHFGRGLQVLVATPANLGWVVIVGASGLVAIVGRVVRNLYPTTKTCVVDALTMAEAYTILGLGVGD
jgi:hypothetical protein